MRINVVPHQGGEALSGPGWPEALLRITATLGMAGAIGFPVWFVLWLGGEGKYVQPGAGPGVTLLILFGTCLFICVAMARQMALRKWACVTGSVIFWMACGLALLVAAQPDKDVFDVIVSVYGLAAPFLTAAVVSAWGRLKPGF